MLREDIRTVFTKDPAARNTLEVLFLYPGFHALRAHRLGHRLWRWHLRTLARLVSHVARHFTGIEIHPGAMIGRRFFIDHGMGVVIGETSEIGDDVLLYQGVVLGGTSSEKTKRHPTLENNVVAGAGAIILGAITVGDHARIGAGSVVTRDVPPDSTVIGVPGRVKRGFSASELQELEHGKLPDPMAEAIRFMLSKYENMDQRLVRLEDAEGVTKQINEELEKKKKEIEEMFKGRYSPDFKDGSGI
jgi:serine O-acetyltransferase